MSRERGRTLIFWALVILAASILLLWLGTQ